MTIVAPYYSVDSWVNLRSLWRINKNKCATSLFSFDKNIQQNFKILRFFNTKIIKCQSHILNWMSVSVDELNNFCITSKYKIENLYGIKRSSIKDLILINFLIKLIKKILINATYAWVILKYIILKISSILRYFQVTNFFKVSFNSYK